MTSRWATGVTPGSRWLRDGPRVLLVHEALARRAVLVGDRALLFCLLLSRVTVPAALAAFGEITGAPAARGAGELRRLERALRRLGLLRPVGHEPRERNAWPT